MKVHEVKILSDFFQAVEAGLKTFECRFNDRNYEVGDVIILLEVIDDMYTGRGISKSISYILEGGQFGIMDGYVVMSLV